MALALQQGGPAMQDALVERLFDDYFIQGLPLSDKSVLLKAAAAAKVEGAEALLDDPDELTEEVFSEVSTGGEGGGSSCRRCTCHSVRTCPVLIQHRVNL
eukprot:scaffold9295_cov122-Isochrysis_galbana.AAC.4